ncbi:hypothetical protein BH09DEP1_BH09DEP1_0420 [soil metagenome]
MKLNYFLLLIFCLITTAMEQPANKKSLVAINPAVKALPIEDLRNVRLEKNSEKKAKLFELMLQVIPLTNAISTIQSLPNPQIIVWFSNYFGSVMELTCDWYNQNLFSKLPKATFWLTDLKAWAFLSVDKEQLKKIYSKLATRIETIQTDKTKTQPLNLSECPLITKSSDVLDEEVNIKTKRYKLLSSKVFFNWLLKTTDTNLISDQLCNALVKEYPRDDGMRFSLADIGYKPAVLNKKCSKLANNQTLLEADFSLVYPILQYLEGIYYASKVIEASNTGENTSVVFLLPNKEFTYYLLPGEKEYFQNFSQGIQR